MKTERQRICHILLCTFFLFIFIPPMMSYAAPMDIQQEVITVKGTVTDKTGEPLIGVSVVVKGTSTGTITDLDGNYSINVSGAEAILSYSYIGYETQEIKVGNQSNINVSLGEDSNVLDEVVVVGYGVQKKVNLTGAVASVGAAKLENRPMASLSQGLGGLAAGVQVRQGGGQPGSDGASISIRGRGTFGGGSTSPLVVIDGVVVDEGNAINAVNSEDVESISILKDAASAAIYGSRGANGVILVNTKKGKKGESPKITYSGLFAHESISSKFKIESSTAEWMEMHNRAVINADPEKVKGDPSLLRFKTTDIEAWRNASKSPNSTDNEWGVPNWLAYPNTNWTDYLYGSGTYQKHTIQALGGSEKSTYLLSASYQSNPGTMPNTSLDEYSFRANVETKIADILRVGTQSYVNHRYGDVANVGSALTYLNQSVPAMVPEYNGKYGAIEGGIGNLNPQSMENSLARMVSRDGKNTTTRINTTWFAGLDISDFLKLDAKYNYQDIMWDQKNYDVNLPRYSFRDNTVLPPIILMQVRLQQPVRLPAKLPKTSLLRQTSSRVLATMM